MLLTAFILLIIAAYLIGSINTSIILTKFVFHTDDIRNSGSGNAGATNMLRTHGKKAGAYTLAGDMLKGVIAVLLGVLLQKLFLHIYDVGPQAAAFDMEVLSENAYRTDTKLFLLLAFPYAAGLFVIIGHIFPVFFKFRGGKGVATSAAVILALHCHIGFAVIAVALIVMIISRYVSLGSIIGAASYPLISLGFFIAKPYYTNLIAFVFAILTAALCIAKHSSNIKRLLKGEENKLGAKKT